MNSVNNQIINNLFKIYRLLNHKVKLDYSLFNLTIIQFHCLAYLNNNKKVLMSEVANYFKITTPTATAIIDRLVKMRLVSRITDLKDRRKIIVKLTKKGKDLFKEIIKSNCQHIKSILSKLSNQEKKRLIKITEKILE